MDRVSVYEIDDCGSTPQHPVEVIMLDANVFLDAAEIMDTTCNAGCCLAISLALQHAGNYNTDYHRFFAKLFPFHLSIEHAKYWPQYGVGADRAPRVCALLICYYELGGE